jgi:predicted ribonuclease YlaK
MMRGSGLDTYLPDTNALLYHVDLDRWSFADSATFELVLAPSVLVELDELKVNHRNPDLREKAEGPIRRIKGYRDRGAGRLSDGVTLRATVSTIRTLAAEPRMEATLRWLDPANRDDRFIASAIGLMRTRPRSVVRIVTRDTNLQNKAEFALMPFCEPPEP